MIMDEEEEKKKYVNDGYFHDSLENGVINKGHVRGEHHELAGLLVLELQGAIPLAGVPCAVEEVFVVLVVESEGVGGPGAIKSTPCAAHTRKKRKKTKKEKNP